MRPRRRRWSWRARLLLAATLAAAAPMLAPATAPAGAEPPGGGPGPTTRGSSESPSAPGVAGVDVLRAADDRVEGSLGGVDAAVEAEVAAVIRARMLEAAARGNVRKADAAVARTRKQIARLNDKSDRVVVDAFVDPPQVDALSVLTTGSTAEATVKKAILDRQSDADARTLAQLAKAKSKLASQQRARKRDAATARDRAADAKAALADLAEKQSQESLFVLTVQDRLADNLSEAEALAKLDPVTAARVRNRAGQLQGQIDQLVAARRQREQQAALRAAMARAAAKAKADAAAAAQARVDASGAAGAGSAGLSTVACPGGGSITVSASIGGNVRSLLAAASSAGLDMCGGGYRDPAEQVALRRAHCGSSNYAIYDAPASACSPPTAKPGSSKHEQGLAIDFTAGGSTIGGGSAYFSWLSAHAGAYGLKNLPSEPWHWSVDGT
ncbi:MAG TPA: M15 family metallopeptidase [Acidimicrobiales bacterium]|nr:M15 family metallopeptidase [Acidimicrobiales bacterium]